MIEIISIGEELLNGSTLNTNAHYIAGQLFDMGFSASYMNTLPDDEEILAAEIEKALGRAKLVITTGGLGPTFDDKTEQVVTKLISSGHRKLSNSIGSASGLLFEEAGLIVLPGVPSEMEAMWQNVKAYIEERLGGVKPHAHKKMTLALLPEQAVDPLLRTLQKDFPGIQFGVYPSYGTLRISMITDQPHLLDEAATIIQEQFPTHIMADRACKAEEALHDLLFQNQSTLGIAECCTGGNISSRLIALPGSSAYFLGSVISYSNPVKQSLLGVSKQTLDAHGAVSKEVATEMCAGVFKNIDSDYAIATTGTAGPTGGTKEKPVGTVWVAIGKKGEKPHVGLVPNAKPSHSRKTIVEKTGTFVLVSLWRLIKHGIGPFEEADG